MVFDYKLANCRQFLMKNGKMCCKCMLYIVFLRSLCRYLVRFCVQHPKNRGDS